LTGKSQNLAVFTTRRYKADVMTGPTSVQPIPAEIAGARSLRSSMLRGLRRRCPACGEGRLFTGYLKVRERCAKCEEPLGHIRADDIPPYVTILIVGHLIVPLVLIVYQNYQPAMWLSLTVWPLLTIVLTLALLSPIKGAIVSAMWVLRLRGDERH
jgi:uncharacterized protein (DUF983 family)